MSSLGVTNAVAKAFSAMPGPRGLPILGNALDYSKFGPFSFERLHEAKQILRGRYGCIYKERLGMGHMVQVFTPEDLEAVYRADGKYPIRPSLPLVTVAHKRDGLPLGLGSINGKEWHSLRSAVQRPMMHPRAGAAYLPAQTGVADDFLVHVEAARDVSTGEVDNFDELIMRYTMESIGTVCFNVRLGVLTSSPSDTADIPAEARDMLAASRALFEAVQQTLFAFPWYAMFRTPYYKQFITAKATCNRVVIRHMDTTMRGIKCTHVTSQEGDEAPPNLLRTLLEGGKVSPEDAADITNDLFIAGIDSTGNALSFVLYNLARNPAIQKTLHEELTAVLPTNGVLPRDVFDSTPYLKACVKESFRLNFPVQGGPHRILEKDLVLSGYTVPKGTLMATNHQASCLNAEYFESPDDYIPERWMKTRPADSSQRPHHPFLLLPFGYGTRMCIGRRFAEQELYLALAKIVPRFHMEYHHEPIGMLNRIFTSPDRPMKLAFFPRHFP